MREGGTGERGSLHTPAVRARSPERRTGTGDRCERASLWRPGPRTGPTGSTTRAGRARLASGQPRTGGRSRSPGPGGPRRFAARRTMRTVRAPAAGPGAPWAPWPWGRFKGGGAAARPAARPAARRLRRDRAGRAAARAGGEERAQGGEARRARLWRARPRAAAGRAEGAPGAAPAMLRLRIQPAAAARARSRLPQLRHTPAARHRVPRQGDVERVQQLLAEGAPVEARRRPAPVFAPSLHTPLRTFPPATHSA